jgi:hypothetical protein
MKQSLLVALLLALTVTAAAQNKPAPATDKEKAEKNRSELYEKLVAPMFAFAEQRKAIIRDLVTTCAKCRALGQAYVDAAGDDAKSERVKLEMDQCTAVLHAKLAITHIEMLTPYAQPVKGADIEDVKWQAMCGMCDAYEYGLERSKLADPKKP